MAEALFVEIGIMIIVATIGGMLAQFLRQPLIPAYILIGILLGPVFGVLTQTAIIEGFGLAGIAFLLFIVGLELNVRKLEGIISVSMIGTSIQVGLSVIIGMFVMILLGYGTIESVYIGFIVAFSSTMVAIKGLSDSRHIHTLHGKVIIGILLMQDLIAIFALSILGSAGSFSAIALLVSSTKAVLVLVGAWLCTRIIYPYVFKRAARVPELLFMCAISVCFIFSIIFHLIGFSIAIGAFVGGVSLASLPYNLEIIARVRSLRDFFATFFFVSLGATLVLVDIQKALVPLFIIIGLVVLFKPFLIMLVCAFFGYPRRISFLASVNLSQVSEFGLILAAQGLALGHISNSTYAITVLAALVTITISSYTTKHSHWIFMKIQRYLRPFDFSGQNIGYIPEDGTGDKAYSFVLVGADRIGYNILKPFQKKKKSFIIIDFNPDIIRRLRNQKIPCIYGDISDPEILERIHAKKLKMLVSTVPTVEDNERILRYVRHVNRKATVFVTAESIKDALHLYQHGADYVILSHFLGGEHVGLLLDEFGDNIKQLTKNKLEHIQELKRRLQMDHEHPKKHE